MAILGFSIYGVSSHTNQLEINDLADEVEVVLGTGHLIDGYHVSYGGGLEARWTAQEFRLSSDGSFMLDLRFDYLSQNPTKSKVYYHSSGNTTTLEVDLEYIGSVILLEVQAIYRYEFFGDFSHHSLTEIIPIIANSTNSKRCFVKYEGNYELPSEIEGQTLFGLEVKVSWIRVFREKTDETFYYQWMQGNSDVWGGSKLEVDKTYNDISGGFLVYYPIPEEVTAPEAVSYKFNYVEWIKENVDCMYMAWIPVDKFALLAPYIGLTILLAVAVITVVYVKKRKRNN